MAPRRQCFIRFGLLFLGVCEELPFARQALANVSAAGPEHARVARQCALVADTRISSTAAALRIRAASCTATPRTSVPGHQLDAQGAGALRPIERHQRRLGDVPDFGFEVPAIDVEFVAAKGNPPLGVGECAQGPTAAAIENAVCDAFGVRVRSLPLTAEQLIAAMPD